MLRKRATLIVETSNGILLVNHLIFGKLKFSLPGGGIKFSETPENAAIRELKEETNLQVTKIKFLFNHNSLMHRHFVFLVKAQGKIKPSWETRHFAYYKKDMKNLSKFTREIIEKYLKKNISEVL